MKDERRLRNNFRVKAAKKTLLNMCDLGLDLESTKDITGRVQDLNTCLN